ncbi:MAG: DUF2975 domain-containing protein [Alteraurantiacibacter sp.]
MTILRTDPLLLAGKAITIFMQGVMVVAAIALFLVIPALFFFGGDIQAEALEEFGAAAGDFPTWALYSILLIGLAVVAVVFFFFDKLRRIIVTVEQGDPFVPVNATRLSHMAWLLLGTQVLMIPAAGLGLTLAKWADEVENANMTVDAGFDLSGVLMVIVLFILARVFKHGAAMREDLEGTV